MADIEIEAEPRTSKTLKLVGVEYDVISPKGSLAIVLAERMGDAKKHPEKVMKSLNEWIDIAFGEVQAKSVKKRLTDPADDLDIPHIMKLMEKLSEASTGNPTT